MVVRRYKDFLILLIPTPLVSVPFTASLLFVNFFSFSFLFQYFFVIKFYVLKYFFAQYKHIRKLRASHGSHMKAAHNVLYMKKHTNVRFISCDGHQLYDFKERGVDLEVEGVRYIEMHRGPAANVLDPPPSRGGDLELEGGVNAYHFEYVSSPHARYRVMAS